MVGVSPIRNFGELPCLIQLALIWRSFVSGAVGAVLSAHLIDSGGDVGDPG